MRYRKLTDDWDFKLGHGGADYLQDSPETVRQAVMTRLKLFAGEWFNDLIEGTAYKTEVLGKYTTGKHDIEIRKRIRKTQGVVRITEYQSSFDSETRKLLIEAQIDTVYGPVEVREVL